LFFEVMRGMVPEYDWDLDRYLRRMWEVRHNHRLFYQSARWRRLRQRVLEEHHYESWDELRATPARYVRATCVHHDRYVFNYPGWALSEFWCDDDGVVHRNLYPLSHEAHDARHGRIRHRQRRPDSELTKEMW
jgi:hypothetical protein